MRHGVLVRCNRQRNNETKHVTMGCVVPSVAGPGRRPTTEAAAMVRQKRMSPKPGAAPLARLPLPVHAPRKRIAKERGGQRACFNPEWERDEHCCNEGQVMQVITVRPPLFISLSAVTIFFFKNETTKDSGQRRGREGNNAVSN